jgi:hypothetical protein
VRVDARTDPEPVALADVRPRVERDFDDDRRRRANREAYERLRERHEIVVDEAAIAAAVRTPVASAGRTP